MKELDLTGRKYLVGIDPSFENFGVCVYDPATNNMQFFSGEWFAAIEWLGKTVKLRQCVAVVENPALDSATFKGLGMCRGVVMQFGNYMKAVGAKAFPFPQKVDWPDVAGRLGIAFRMASNVGESKAAGKLIVKMLERHKVPTLQIAPSDRERADKKRVPVGAMVMPTKTTNAQFENLTGYKGRTSEHARDAATLVFGRSIDWAAWQLLNAGTNDKAAKTRKKSVAKREAAEAVKREVPKSERKFFNVVGNGQPGQRVEKIDGKFVFVED